jgi:drug/metabolite transporter (DMT)-like permease
MNVETLSILCGLFAAASWGAGDFGGGFASKKTSVYMVILISQFVGFLLMLFFSLIMVSSLPSARSLIIGGAAGLSGAFGLLALYQGLASENMGVVAPVTAVIASILPVAVSIYSEGLPSSLQMLGFLLAVIGIWFLTQGNNRVPIQLRTLGLPFTAGIGFGLFFILVDQVSKESILWPLIAARVTSVVLFGLIVKSRRIFVIPPKKRLLYISLAGFFDSGGNVFFALATRFGRLDIASVLSSLYPAVTVLLAWFFLKERLVCHQWLGISLVMIALILISI